MSKVSVEHVLRTPMLNRATINHNYMADQAGGGKHVWKLHALAWDDVRFPAGESYTRYVLASDNIFKGTDLAGSDWTVGVGPSDIHTDARVVNVIFERNFFKAGASTTTSLNIWARNVTARNNIFETTAGSTNRGIFVTRRGIEPPPQDIYVYDNSAYGGDSNTFILAHFSQTTNGVARNNLGYAPTSTNPLFIYDDGTNTGFVQSNNLLATSSPFVSANLQVASDFKLASGSAAIDNGTSVPVFDDFDGNTRPVNGAWDIGAFEYMSGGGDGNCTQDNRSLGINLDSPVDYSTELPFVDFFKLTRPWISTDISESVWSTGVADKIPKDENGYPLEIPYNVPGYGTQILHTLMAREISGRYPSGNYTLFFEGKGRIRIDYDAETKVINQSGTSFKVTPGNTGIHLTILESNISDHIRNIRVIMPGFENNYTTSPFNPKFIERLKEFRVVRFLNWMEAGQENNIYGNTVAGSNIVNISGSGAGSLKVGDKIALGGASYSCNKGFTSIVESINGNSITLRDSAIATVNNVIIVPYDLINWSERVKKDYYTQASERGVALEYLVEMANAARVSPWFTIRHRASDEYLREFAVFTKNNLNPELIVYLEYSNEVWNGLFKQCVYAIAKGSELGFPGNEWYQGWYYRSRRSVEMFNIWSDVFGEFHLKKDRNGSRLIRVLGGQNAWIGQNVEVMDFKTNGHNASEYADALAITIYFGGGITSADENLTIDELFAKIEQDIDDSFNSSSPRVSNFKNAKSRGLDLVGYEAGTHVWVRGATAAFDAKLDSMMRDERIKELYSRALNYWKGLGIEDGTGAKIVNMFTLASRYAKGHRWGHLEYIDQEPSTAPKYWGLIDFMNNNPVWWDESCMATCTPLWSCTAWSVCNSGVQTRVCTDTNNCGTDSGKPTESQSCVSIPQHPNMFLNQQEIDTINVKIANNEQPWKNAYDELIVRANGLLSSSIKSVVDNGGGVSCDTNPWTNCAHQWATDLSSCSGANRYDYSSAHEMGANARDLAIAYVLSNDVRYAQKSIDILYAWGVDPAKYMIPKMWNAGPESASCSQGHSQIEIMITIPTFFYAADLVRGHPYWEQKSAGSETDFIEWANSFRVAFDSCWYPEPTETYLWHNNWYTWCLADKATVAAYLDNETSLNQVYDGWRTKATDMIGPNGRIESEYRRVDNSGGLDYSFFALGGMLQIAEIARHRGVDLYDYVDGRAYNTGTDERPFKRAYDFHVSYVTDPSTWIWCPSCGISMRGSWAAHYEIAYSHWKDSDHLSLSNAVGRPLSEYWTIGPTTLTHGEIFHEEILGCGNGICNGGETCSSCSADCGICPDVTPPTPPTLSVSAVGMTQINLSWTASTDDVGVAGYRIYRNNVIAGTSAGTTYSDNGLLSGTLYRYNVTAYDASGKNSTSSNQVSAVTLADTTPPTINSVNAPINTSVVVVFNENVDETTAETIGNYNINNGISVLGAVLGADKKTVTLATSQHSSGVSYTLNVTNVEDIAGNAIALEQKTYSWTATNPMQGLVGHWKFDEGSGTTAADSSGNGHTGTLNGGTWTTGNKSGGLQFDGTNDYVEALNSQLLNINADEITLAAWVYFVSNGQAQIIIAKPVSSSSHTSPYFQYGLHTLVSGSSGQPRFWITLGSSGRSVASSINIPENKWSHVTGVYDGSQMRIYVNGILGGTASFTGNIASHNTPLRIGINGGLGEGWNGKLDEVMVFNRSLSASEILELYNGGTERAPLPPSGLSASLIGDSVQLNWSDNSFNEEEFVIERSADGGNTWEIAGRVGAGIESFDDNGELQLGPAVQSLFEKIVEFLNRLIK